MTISKTSRICTALSVLATCAIAQAEVVVVVSASSPAAAMTAKDVSDLFLGRSNALTPINQAEGSAIRDEFYSKATGKNPSQVKAVWTKLIFTGKTAPPKNVASSADVMKIVAADARAIGYMEKSATDSSVKVILTLP